VASQGVDVVSAGVSSIALPWLVLDGGGSNTEAGFVFAFSMLPYVIFGLLAGVVGDRYDRRTIMWVTHTLQVVAALLVPIWALTGQPPLVVILGAAFTIGSARVFVDASVFGAVAAIIGRKQFARGQATLSASWAMGMLAGPALGGVLIAAFGPAVALVAEAGGFAVAAALILMIRAPLDASDRRGHEPAVEMMKEGLAVIWRSPRIRVYTWLSVAWNLGAAASAGLVVPLLRDTIGLGSTQAGVVIAVGAMMGLFVPTLLGWALPRVGAAKVTTGATALSACAIFAMGISPGFLSVLVSSAARSLSDYTILSTVIGERQRGVPDRLQARVGISIRMIAVMAITVGSAVGSILADPLGVRTVFLLSAGAVGLVLLVAIPSVLRVGRLVDDGG
jgi:MFS family permease